MMYENDSFRSFQGRRQPNGEKSSKRHLDLILKSMTWSVNCVKESLQIIYVNVFCEEKIVQMRENTQPF